MDTKAKPNNPMAFPCNLHNGMSLRDWFAGQALAGLLAGGSGSPWELDAKNAYIAADAMLAVREGGAQ